MVGKLCRSATLSIHHLRVQHTATLTNAVTPGILQYLFPAKMSYQTVCDCDSTSQRPKAYQRLGSFDSIAQYTFASGTRLGEHTPVVSSARIMFWPCEAEH